MSNYLAHRLLLGSSAWSAHARDRIAEAAASRQNVLITGPSGTGKKYLARAIHDLSSVRARPFVPLHCELLPSPLFESQLFGHVAGALVARSGATMGSLRVADGGTVLLDSPAALDIASQERLLRALQQKQYFPVGAADPVELNVRFIAASSDDLQCLVDEGRFLQELYEELSQLAITTVALQQRAEDIAILAEHFLAEKSAHCAEGRRHFSGDALRWLQSYSWPGNVGELKTLVDQFTGTAEEVGLDAVLSATAVLTAKPYVRKMLRRFVGFAGLRALEVHACRLDQAHSCKPKN
jgi:DNA-binding NtrC family response regulator